MIHLLDGQNNEILATATKKDVLSNEHTQSLESYVESFEFTVKGDTKFAEKLAERNRIIIPSEDEGYIEFIVDKVVKKRKNGLKVRVLAMGSYLDLKKSEPIEPQTLTEYTGSMALGFVTNGTEWQPGRVESSNYRTFNIDNHVDVFTFLKRVANELDLELNFRIETRGGRVTGRYVDLLDGVGDWKGREVTFGKDLDTIKREEDFENVYTALKCIAPEDDDGNRLETIVEDKDALRRWGRPNPQTGELMHLMDVYEPQSDRQDMTLEELEQYGRTELNKRINSVVTYDIDVIDLENVPGMANKKIRFGDTIRIKDEKFNPSLYVEARVFEQRRDIFTKANKRIKLGDFTEFTEEEVQSVWQSLQAQINARVSQAELIEYTYDKITIDDKDEHVFEEGKSFAEAVGIEAKEYAESQDEIVKQHADTVAGEAENNAKTYAEDRSAEALQQALAKSVAQEVYDNKMQEIADDLADRTTFEYVDGQLQFKADNSVVQEIDGKVSDLETNVSDAQGKISDAETEIESVKNDIATKADAAWVDGQLQTKADADSVYTTEEVDNAVNSRVSKTEYQTDQNAVVTRFENNESAISQNADEISQRVTKTEFKVLDDDVNNVENGLKTRVLNAETGITQNANEIDLRATKTEVEGIDNRLSDAESSITVNAVAIEQRVTKTEFQDLESDVDGVESRISSAESTITQHANLIEQRVTKTEYETLESDVGDIETRVSSAETRITQNEGQINLKASRSDLDTVSGDVSTISGQLDVLAGEVSAKAEQSSLETLEGDVTKVSNDLSELTVSVDGISGNVSSLSQTVSDQDTEISSLESSYNQIAGQIEQKVDSTTYQADIDGIIQNLDSQSTAISQNADAIDLKASSTRVDAIEGTVEDHNAQFDVMAGQISSKVDSTYVRGVVNQFKRYDSSFSNEQEFWNSQSWQGSYSGEVLTKGNTMTFRKVDGAKSGKVAVSTNSSETLYSRYAEPIDTLRRYRGRIRIRNTSTADSRIYLGIVCLDKDYNFISGGSGTHRWFLDAGSMVTVPAESDWIELQGDINGIGDDRRSFREGTSYIRICALCNHGFNNSELEIDYIEFEDITDIQNVNNRVSSAETLINQKADSVTVQAISTEVDAIEGRISTAESDITTMAGQIDLKASSVDVDGIESRVSSAELSINGLEGQITSKVEENDVRSIFTQQASSFTFEADQINFDGHVFGQDATFTGKLEGAEITQAGENNSIIMNNDGFYVIDNEFGAKRIAIENIFEPTGTNMYDPHPNFIYFEKDSDIEFRIGGGGPGTGYEDMFLGFSGSNPGIMGIRAGSAMNLYSDKFNFEGGSAEFRSGIYLPNASGFTSDDPQEIMLPYNNRISTHGEGLAIYGNRNNDNNPFKVRSHDNIGSYRNDFEIDGASGRIVSEPTVDNTTTNSANIHVFTSTGRFSRSTSARRYKILEEPIKNDVANKIMNLSPKNWYDKRSFEGYAEYLHRIETGKAVSSDLDLPELLRRTPGLVAEDIEEAGLGDFVQYSEPDEKGKRTVEGVMYDRLWTLLIPIVKELRNEVDSIKQKLEESK